jgi:hypothetical protein
MPECGTIARVRQHLSPTNTKVSRDLIGLDSL